MAEGSWNRDSLEARIACAGSRARHAGGSPDPQEIAAYSQGLAGLDRTGTAVVLGMTPELRRLALRHFTRVEVIDSNAEAIALYRDWVEQPLKGRERLVQADWFALGTVLVSRPVAVLGDGVFGNLADVDAHHRLLHAVRDVLVPAGRFVTRMAMIPEGFEPAAHRASVLLARFRAGLIDAAEFGFGMRLVGHYEECYDPASFQLDNATLFARCDEAFVRGRLTPGEIEAIRRYRFSGRNCILPQREWEKALVHSGFRFEQRRCHGKAWYDYYVIYECRTC